MLAPAGVLREAEVLSAWEAQELRKRAKPAATKSEAVSFIALIPFSFPFPGGKKNPQRLSLLLLVAFPFDDARHFVDYPVAFLGFGLRLFVVSLLLVSGFALQLSVTEQAGLL